MNLTGKKFRAVANSSNGTLDTETTMTFVAEDESGIVGIYGGGTIGIGNVLARRTNAVSVEMLYQCITISGELKAGKATATFREGAAKRLHMDLDWQWLTGDRSKGASEWVHDVP